LPHAGRVDERLAASGQRDQAELATFYLDRGRRLFEQEHDREAIVELNHAVYLSPYLAEAHLLLGRIYLRDGQTREAIDALKISLWSTESADAHATLGEAYRQTKDLAAARSEAQRALALDPASKDARELLATLDGR
jgi:tetratricopeptide (TPR) repeat protein